MKSRHRLADIPRTLLLKFSGAVLALTAILSANARSADEPAVIHVAADGRDEWSGRLDRPTADGSDGPLATLSAAVAASRKQAGQPRRIVLAPGEYFLQQPVVLSGEDSGLTIEAAQPGAVTLVGGRPVTPWQRDGESFWSASLPDVASGAWDFRMLEVNGRLAPRARFPEEGELTHETRFDVPWMSTTGGGWKRKPTPEELTTLHYREGDLGAWLDPKSAEVTVFHMWDESVVGVARHDAERRELIFSTPCGHPPGAFGVQKYVLWNVRRGMTRPGQWYLDRSAGKLVVWPLEGEDMTAARVVAPTMESLLRIAGAEGKPARDIVLRGLKLKVAGTPLVSGGFGAGRFPGAIELAHAEGCRLEELEICNVAGQAVKASRVRGCRIAGCHIHDVGACGIRFDGGCAVEDNHVHHVGRIYPSAIAISGGGRGGEPCRIAHNTVHHTTYSAITCGGDGHVIEANRIHHAMEVLHDGAGIYITFCKRITVRGNYIHDITDTGGYGASAYYLDEQAEDCLVEGNLSVRVARPSHNHMARRNTIRGNVFLCDGDATLTFPRSSEFTFERNVVACEGTLRFTNPAAVTQSRDNVLFSRAGKVEGVTLADYSSAGTTPFSAGAAWTLADPGLTLDEAGAVQFAPESPARKLGIPDLDVRSAGCGE